MKYSHNLLISITSITLSAVDNESSWRYATSSRRTWRRLLLWLTVSMTSTHISYSLCTTLITLTRWWKTKLFRWPHRIKAPVCAQNHPSILFYFVGVLCGFVNVAILRVTSPSPPLSSQRSHFSSLSFSDRKTFLTDITFLTLLTKIRTSNKTPTKHTCTHTITNRSTLYVFSCSSLTTAMMIKLFAWLTNESKFNLWDLSCLSSHVLITTLTSPSFPSSYSTLHVTLSQSYTKDKDRIDTSNTQYLTPPSHSQSVPPHTPTLRHPLYPPIHPPAFPCTPLYCCTPSMTRGVTVQTVLRFYTVQCIRLNPTNPLGIR